MQHDGNLVIIDNNGGGAYYSNTYNNPGAYLELEDTELFSETYEKIKKDFENDNKNEIYRSKYNLYESWRIDDHKKSLIEFESNTLSKSFSFLNRWVIFKKI
jgi:hypothetical protein